MDKERITETRREKKLSFNTIENTFNIVGKLTPQAIEFEEAILGALMIDKDAIAFIDFLHSKMFYKEQHQYIFQTIVELFQDSIPIDLLSVTEKLRKNKQLDFIGGASYLASLTNRVASSANIEYHGRVVMEKFVLRELISISTNIIQESYDDSKDVIQLLDKAETELFGIIQNNFKRESKILDEVVKKALDELMEIRNKDESYQGVPTGIKAIDEKIGGWQKSDLIIIAARPGMGKTSFVLSIARNAVLDFKKPVAVFSLEMSAIQLAHRLFSMESGISAQRISKGNLDEEEWIRLMDKIQTLNAAPLFIDDTPALSIFDLRAKCRRLKHKHDIQLVMVDYLQLMQGHSDDGKGRGNREQEISYISRSLKALARELNIPVVALSQLSREVEKRVGSKRPQLSDLRESGSIEQDADLVIFIYRPEYYGFTTFEQDDMPAAGLADIMIEKNRHGANDRIRVKFIQQYTKFTDMEEGYSFQTHDAIPENKTFHTATIVESSMNDDLLPDSDDNAFPY